MTAIAMLFLHLNLQAEVRIETEDNSIIASTNSKGTAGNKGCKGQGLRAVDAYVFKLLKRDTLEKVCRPNQDRKWKVVKTTTNNNGETVFYGLDKGEYRVECLIGEAKGCLIDDSTEDPLRSIIYRKESSSKVYMKKRLKENLVFQKQTVTSLVGDILVFPNPANERIKIKIESNAFSGVVNVSLLSLMGKEMISIDEFVNSKDGQLYEWEIETAEIPIGTYILQINDEAGLFYRQKVVIVHGGIDISQPTQTFKNH